MNVFRSEDHIGRWLADRAPGQTFSSGKLGELAAAWYQDRLLPDWQPHTRDQNQAILDSLGFRGEFWQLPRH